MLANPLNKRFPRELKNNLGKYLGMFAMMVFAIAFTSGFLMTANSIQAMMETAPETYRIEDGRFTCYFEAEEEAIAAVEELGVSVTEDFYKQSSLNPGNLDDGAQSITARIYARRTNVNIPAYAQGHAPERAGEVALDRVFMANHNLGVGDHVTIAGEEFEITGVLCMPDYQALFENNNNFMFDAITFTVGEVAQTQYVALRGSETFNYSFRFNDQALDLAERTDIEEDMIDALSDHDAVVSDFIDSEDNQGIGYALDDVEGDSAMWTVLLFLLVVIMAFVFVVLTGATIEAESATIGTMLASGWRKGELVRHYLVLPCVVGAAAVAVGLAVGLTLLTEPFANLYYNSYSLPPLVQVFSWRVVILTAVVPYALLVGITLFGLMRKMRFTPLQFLRHETSARKRNASLPLPEGLRYPTKFRLRVLLRNASHFITLFFGIMFASLLLLFGTCMLPVVDNYAKDLRETVVSPHQYMLKTPVELEGTAEERARYAAALRLVEDRDRYNANKDAIDAAERLSENKELMDAIDRLHDNGELMDALERLQDNGELMAALDRLQANEQTMGDLVLLSTLDETTQADVDLLRNVDDRTRADIDLVRGVDGETQADIDLVRGMDESLLDDVRLAAEIDDDAHVVNSQVNSDAAREGSEKFAMGSVEILRRFGEQYESVTVYGIQPNSVYWTDIPVQDGTIVAGRGTLEKTRASLGQTVEAVNRRTGETYELLISDEGSNAADVSLYMTLDDFNKLFGKDADYFNAYASADELAIDDRYLARSIVPEDMDKISNQMADSMSNIMLMMMLMAVPIYFILVYLLTKTVIDRSARSISYMKVFGYHAREVNGLYVRPMTFWVLFCLIASIPLILVLITGLLTLVFTRFAGNFTITVPPLNLVELVIIGMATYAIVALLHVRRIRKVPLELAMKVQE